MKLLNKYTGKIAAAFLLLFVSSCADLAVDNKNEPSQEQVIQSASDVVGLVEGGWASYALNSHAYQSAALNVQADWFTGTVGNWWINDAGHEVGSIEDGTRERVATYPNTPTTSYPVVVNLHWTNYYGALSNVNTALSIMDSGSVEMGSEANELQLRATAQLLQGVTTGSIGLIFDQGYIIDENSDILNVELSPYQDVIAAAVAKLEEAMATADAAEAAGSEGVSSDIIPLLGSASQYQSAEEIDWAEFKQIANTYAATFLTHAARTTDENENVDWDAVYNYANNGITFDFAPYSDDNNWVSYLYLYMNADWYRVDMKIVNKLDPNQPLYWPTTDGQNGQGSDAPDVNSPDERFGTDYIQSNDWSVFNATRGYYKRSHVSYNRYTHFSNGLVWSDPLPYILRAQNNLLIAEAELERAGGSKANAIEQINETRVGRGGLPELTAGSSDEEIREALEYEWDIEVAVTGVANLSPWYNSRRWGQLLKGSMLHLPVPAGELGILEQPYYSFGGGGEGSAPKFNPNSDNFDKPAKPDK